VTGRGQAALPFTAFLIYAVARAVAEDAFSMPTADGTQLILFDEVDVDTQIEVEAECPGGAWGVPIDAPQPTRGAGEGCGGT
jgi:hypothetical protein